MKLSELNEYMQTAAALGAILALFAVGYEIRQSNRIAIQQSLSANWTNWAQFHMSEVESGISSVLSNAVTQPEELTFREEFEMDSWLSAYISLYQHDYLTQEIGNAPEFVLTSILESLEGDAPIYFASTYSHAWFEANKYWMSPEIAETLAEAIKNIPDAADVDS